jgi:hypothetical protein
VCVCERESECDKECVCVCVCVCEGWGGFSTECICGDNGGLQAGCRPEDLCFASELSGLVGLSRCAAVGSCRLSWALQALQACEHAPSGLQANQDQPSHGCQPLLPVIPSEQTLPVDCDGLADATLGSVA